MRIYLVVVPLDSHVLHRGGDLDLVVVADYLKVFDVVPHSLVAAVLIN